MGRNARETGRSDRPGSATPPPAGAGTVAVLTLVGVGIVLFLSAVTWSTTRSLQQGVDAQMNQIRADVAQLDKKLEAGAARAATPPRQGPDPNRVYSVKTQGAPAEGPAAAPVTIAEFSEFQ